MCNISSDSVWAQDTEWVEMEFVEYIYNTQKERVNSNARSLEMSRGIDTSLQNELNIWNEEL